MSLSISAYVVEHLYDSITDWDVGGLFFTIKVGRVVKTFDPFDITSIIRAPRNPRPDTQISPIFEYDRYNITIVLCRNDAR